MKEASEALQASESCASAMQEELIALKHNHEADIQRAVSNGFTISASAFFCAVSHS